MYETHFLFLGTIAFLWTVLTALAASVLETADNSQDALAMVAGVIGFILWGVWSFAALNVQVIAGGQTTATTYSSPELAIVGVMLALVPGWIALTGPFELVSRWRDGNMDEL